MRIESTATSYPILNSRALPDLAAPTSEPVAPAPIDPAPAAPVEPAPQTPPEPTFSRAHGMLRKLVAGGFNPVAAARHQAKFESELKEAGITLPEPAAPSKSKLAERYAPATPAPAFDAAA